MGEAEKRIEWLWLRLRRSTAISSAASRVRSLKWKNDGCGFYQQGTRIFSILAGIGILISLFSLPLRLRCLLRRMLSRRSLASTLASISLREDGCVRSWVFGFDDIFCLIIASLWRLLWLYELENITAVLKTDISWLMVLIVQVKDAIVQFETALSLDPNPIESQAAYYNKACCHAYRYVCTNPIKLIYIYMEDTLMRLSSLSLSLSV